MFACLCLIYRGSASVAIKATPPKQHGFSAEVASSPLRRSVRSLPLSWSSPSSRSLVPLARRQLCTSSLQMLAGRRLLSPAASLTLRRRPTAVDCSWHRDLDPPLVAVAESCVKNNKAWMPKSGPLARRAELVSGSQPVARRWERRLTSALQASDRQRLDLVAHAVSPVRRPWASRCVAMPRWLAPSPLVQAPHTHVQLTPPASLCA